MQRRMEMELQQIIEGLALQKTKPTAAAIYRQVQTIAKERQWPVPSYSTVYDIVRSLDRGWSSWLKTEPKPISKAMISSFVEKLSAPMKSGRRTIRYWKSGF